MVSQTRKRILLLFGVAVILFLLVRYFLFNGSFEADSQSYRRAPGAPVLVAVFYEALCPDSKHFITKQLVPSYRDASPLMDIILVPYGKASTMTNPDGSYRFDCQHGQVECEANTYHACTIEAVQEPQTRLSMVACMIRDNRLPKEALHKCAKQHNIDNVDLIQKCYDSSHGSELLKLNGDLTHALRPPVTFIPTITLDGSQGKQALILKNLLAEICKIAGDNDKAEEICRQHM
ncbi:gamma-interferon-inducible lysosomal thiol reductase-like protein isoform X2 [Haematobia irritans]|uniref:gamma-interferon-inducible lysosomal thiol reductase-like protein isoform X2 n=1 Tax=Haematobia irritans TaxID=7368 RepID=UPI003F50911F